MTLTSLVVCDGSCVDGFSCDRYRSCSRPVRYPYDPPIMYPIELPIIYPSDLPITRTHLIYQSRTLSISRFLLISELS